MVGKRITSGMGCSGPVVAACGPRRATRDATDQDTPSPSPCASLNSWPDPSLPPAHFSLNLRTLRFLPLGVLHPLVNASDNCACVVFSKIECESSTPWMSSIRGLKLLQASICTDASMWMRSLGYSPKRSSRQKQRRLPSRWRVVARILKTRCWMYYGKLRCN